MRIIAIISIFLLAGCSANWHLNKAIEKDSSILTTDADTTEIEKITYRPATIFVQDSIKLSFASDTIFFDTLTKFKGYDMSPIVLNSRDSIAHAKIWINNGRLMAEVWATVDTSINWTDSIEYLQKEIYREREIRRETEVKFKKQMSFFETLKMIAILTGIVMAIILILTLIKRTKS